MALKTIGGTENNWRTSLLLGFLKPVFLSDKHAVTGRSTTLTDNSLRLCFSGKIVCQIPQPGTTVGSVGGCAGADVHGEPGTTSQSICSLPCFWQVTPQSSPVLAAGPSRVFSVRRPCNGTEHLQICSADQPVFKFLKTKNTHSNPERAAMAWKSGIWLQCNTVSA